MELSKHNCEPCENISKPLTEDQILLFIKDLDGWEYISKSNQISKKYNFKDYYQTMAFVNMVAFISHFENHHPTLNVRFDSCTVKYKTFNISGLSKNDFICAAKIDKLINKNI